MAFPLIGIVVSLLVSVGLSAILRALTRPPQAEAGDVEVPRVEEGETIAAVFGTVKLAPNIVWWGDVEPKPIKGPRRISAFGIDIQGPRPTIGYRYYVGMQGALCWGPIDELVEIVVADKYKLSSYGSTTTREYNEGTGLYDTTTTQVVAPPLPIARVDAGVAVGVVAANLFGGKELEGGVLGTLRMYFGSTTQNANAYLESKVANPFPAYRGLCYVVWEHVYLGTTPYLKNWAFVVRRCPTTLGALAGDVTLSRIGDDANPAEVLYELWTDTRWGLGKPASDLDTASFLAALQTLSDEGMGISGPHGGTGEAEGKFKEILRHIDAVFGPDPLTGKMRLKLIRADYDVSALPVIDASNGDQLNVTRPVSGERTTQVKVNFTDAAKDFTTRTRQAHNPAVERAQGYAIPAVVSYPLFTTPANAERAAARECRALSASLAAGSVVANRSAAALGPGDPFILNFPTEGLVNVVVRGTRFNYGAIHGEEPVEIRLAEDVFGAAGGVQVIAPPDEWTPPGAADPGLRFDVETEFTVGATQGCLTLRITGDVSAISLVETQTQQGGEDPSGWTAQDNSAPITVCVDRDDREVGRIAYRITYTEADGTTQTLEDEFLVPPLLAETVVQAASSTTVLPIFDGGTLLALKNQPPEEKAYFPRARPWFDASGRTHARVIADVDAPGAVNARLIAKFAPDPAADPDDPASWVHAGELGLELPVSIAIAGPQRGDDYLPLHADAQADVRWQLFGKGGDGVLSPVVGKSHIQFRTGAEPTREKWYWRDLAPADAPAYFDEAEPGLPSDPADFALMNDWREWFIRNTNSEWAFVPWSSLCDPPLGSERYITPTREDVETMPRLASRTKAPNDLGSAAFVSASNDVHKDLGGSTGRIVFPPLVGGQLVSAFTVEHWYAAVAPSAYTDGTVDTRLWVWRPGVGRLWVAKCRDLTEADLVAAQALGGIAYPIDGGPFAIAYDPEVPQFFFATDPITTPGSGAGGPDQKYVRYIGRQVHNWGRSSVGFETMGDDRFILDVRPSNRMDCGGASHSQGLGVNVSFNGTIEPSDPEGTTEGWTGVAAYTLLPSGLLVLADS